MKRKQPENDRLRKASDHLFYEIAMLNGLAQGLASGIAGESVINNALLESFAVHARALLDFLYRDEPRYEDDVVAQHFFATPEQWANARSAKTKTLERVHRRVAKEVAHLTYARQQVTPQAKGWPFMDIAKDINTVIDDFLGMLPDDLLGPRWNEYKKERGRSESS